MHIDELLSRLTKVKKSGQDKWIACCPAHEDRSPSLSIKESDGTILMKCFAGCSIEDVCGAMGIDLTELFPPRDDSWVAQEKPVKIGTIRFAAIDALRCLSNEGTVVLLAACDLAEGKVLSAVEIDRLTTAVSRLSASLDYLNDQDIERATIL